MKLALIGQTVLGRTAQEGHGVREPTELIAEEVAAVAREADLVVLDLGCAISGRGAGDRGEPPSLFQAPPAAVEVLRHLGVDCVTLGSGHLLDSGTDALLDTFHHLDEAGIGWAGAGVDERAAHAPVVLERAGVRVGIIAVTDDPAGAAGSRRPGLAFADLEHVEPSWLLRTLDEVPADVVLLAPRWGPAFVTGPVPHVRRAAARFRAAGADLVAGSSAHSVHGVADRVLYNLGDFVRRGVVDPDALNDLGLLFLVTLQRGGPTRLEAVPLALEDRYTRLAEPVEAVWMHRHFRAACAALGTEVGQQHGRLVVDWDVRSGQTRSGVPGTAAPRPAMPDGTDPRAAT